MKTTRKKLPKATSLLTLTIPWKKVEKAHNQVVEEAVKEIEVKGFRKGKAPKKLAEKHLDKAKITQAVFNEILPPAYTEAIKEHELKPVAGPKIEPEKTEEGKDWVFKVTVAEKPEIKLGDYKNKVKEVTKKSPKIWTPGGKDKGKDKEKEKEKKEPPLREIFEALLKTVKVEISDLLIENEANRLLSQTLEEVKKLGLTLQAYLDSIGKTSEALRQEAQKQAEETLKLEFILAEIAEEENISVEPEEIDDFLKKTKDEKARKSLENQRYYLASVIRKRKILDFLSSL